MARKGHTPEQVIDKLREAEVAISEGSKVAKDASRIGVTEQTFYRWCCARGVSGSTKPGPGDLYTYCNKRGEFKREVKAKQLVSAV